MEPENNMENKAPENTAPEITEMAAEEVVVTEAKPVAEEAPKDMPKGDIVFNNKPKKKTGMILTVILLLLIAAGGIGFGVWAWMEKDNEMEVLNNQISTLKKQNEDLTNKFGDGDTIIDIDMGDAGVNTEDYIYVGEWGLKIKIPDGLKRVSYQFSQRDENLFDGTVIEVWGNIDDRLPDFANVDLGTSLGAVSRIPKGAYNGSDFSDDMICGYSVEIFSDDQYHYCYAHPQAVYSTSDEEQGLEVSAAELIQQMLSSKDSYSAI